MTKIVYVGVFPEVEIADAGVVAVRGVPVEVGDELAVRLLEQPSNWKKAPRGKERD